MRYCLESTFIQSNSCFLEGQRLWFSHNTFPALLWMNWRRLTLLLTDAGSVASYPWQAASHSEPVDGWMEFPGCCFSFEAKFKCSSWKTSLWTGHILRPINARAQNSPVCSFISPQREIQLCMHAYHKMELLDLAQLLFPMGGYWRNKTSSCSSLLYRPEDMEACFWKNNRGLLTFLSSEGLVATLTILIKCMSPRSASSDAKISKKSNQCSLLIDTLTYFRALYNTYYFKAASH